jgi:hypothetical protein
MVVGAPSNLRTRSHCVGICCNDDSMTNDDMRESRAALILLAVAVASVLIFGVVTILIQL